MATTIDTRVYMNTRGGLTPIPGAFLDENGEPVEDVRCDCCGASIMIKVLDNGATLGRTCYRVARGIPAPRPRLWVARTSIRDGRTIDWLRMPNGGGRAWISVGGDTIASGVRLDSKRDAVAMAKRHQEGRAV